MKLSIALPCYNEEPNIVSTIEEIEQWFEKEKIDGEIIAVDDGSRDGTWEKLQALAARYPNVKILRHEVNKGYGSALKTGLEAATMDFMGYMDSDGQFRVEDFSALVPHLRTHRFVTGRRAHRADPFIRKVNAKLFGLLNVFVLRIWVRDINCAMKVWHREIWEKIRPVHSTGALINAEIFYRLKENRIPWKVVPVRHFPRERGAQTGAKIGVILLMFRDLFRLKRRYKSEKKKNSQTVG